MGVALKTVESTSEVLINANITKLKLDITISTTSTNNIAKYIYKLYMVCDGGVWVQNTSKNCYWRIKCADLGLDAKGSFNAVALNGLNTFTLKEGTCYQPPSLTSKNSTTITVYAFFEKLNSSQNCYTKGTTSSALNNGGWPITQNLMSTSAATNEYRIYTINYIDESGDSGVDNIPGPQYKLYGDAIKLQTAVPTRPNYNFQNWKKKNASTTYLPGANYTTNADLTLNPVWSTNNITISYSAGTGEWTGTSPAATTTTAGSSITLTNTQPIKTGYTFAGWTDGTTIYAGGSSQSFQKTTELQPVFNIKDSTKSLQYGQIAIFNGSEFYGYNTYMYIDNGWKPVLPMIFDGISWKPCKHQEN